MNQYLAEVSTDPDTGDLILTFPPDLLAKAGWFPGDDIELKEENGSLILHKISG